MNDHKICREIRTKIIDMLYRGKGGHIGSSLSLVEILYVLYFKILRINPSMVKDVNRDRLILGSSQGALALYCVMHKAGFFPNQWLDSFLKREGALTTFPNISIPGIEMTSGSLGHGLSFGIGVALYAKRNNIPCQIYVIIGDGELQEGSIWEGIMSAAHFKLDNLTLIINRNYLQVDSSTEKMIGMEPLANKCESFGWKVYETDGHNFKLLEETFNKSTMLKNQPKVIIAKTIKGKGISFMENNLDWHFKIPTNEEYERAKNELRIKLS